MAWASLIPWILLILFVAVCGLAGWAFWVWWQRDHYTRQKFAFVGFSALTGLAILYLSSLSLEKSVLSLISHTLFQPFGIDVPTAPLTPLEAVLFSVVFFALIYAYLEIFKHWDGQKTIAQHEQEQIKESPNLWKDIALLFARDPELRKKLQLYQGNVEVAATVLEKPETLAWHQRARQLWTLRHRTYLFESEYDPSHGWLGEEKNTGTLVLLACFTDAPSKAEIDKLAEYAQQVADRKQTQAEYAQQVADRKQTQAEYAQQVADRKQTQAEYAQQVADRKQTQFELILAVKNGTENKLGSRSYPLKYTSEVELLDNLVNFDDYFNDIRYRVEHAKLPGSDWTLQNMYTPSRYRFHGKEQPQAETIEQFIFRWLAENTPRQLAVLGEYGQGKSTLSLLLCYQLMQQSKTDATVRIPILIELRGKTLRTLQPEELLAIWAKNYHIDPQALLHLHLAGRLLLIFEGFDEIDLSGDTEARIAHFRTLWQFNYNHAKIIITGRPNFFLDSQELRRALGDAQQSYTLHLEPFAIEQIQESLRLVGSKTCAEIIALAEKNKKFRDVVERPSLLYIVALLWEKEKLSERAHLNSADVIDLFIKHSLQRQQTKQDNRKFMVLNSAERLYFMKGIAAYMAAKQLQNQIDKLQLEAVVNLLVTAIPDEVSRQVTQASGEDSRPLRSEERLKWSTKRKEIMEQIQTDVRSCGLLVTDLSKDGAFKFAHKSYMELLQAQVIYQSSFATESVEQQAGKSVSNTFKLQLTDLQKSDESIGFLAELLKSDINRQGTFEESTVAQRLWQILVIGKLSRHTLSSFLVEYGVKAASGLINNSVPPVKIWSNLLKNINEPLLYMSDKLVGISRTSGIGEIVTSLSVSLTIGIIGTKLLTQEGWSQREALTLMIPIALFYHVYFVVLLLTLDFSNKTFNSSISKQLLLWYRACKSLNFSQESIEKVVGKGMAQLLAERAGKQQEKQRL